MTTIQDKIDSHKATKLHRYSTIRHKRLYQLQITSENPGDRVPFKSKSFNVGGAEASKHGIIL
jgi:hypothetical protein